MAALRRDALARLWRTVLQGLLVTALVGGFTAAQDALGDRPFDWPRVGWVAGSAAGMVVPTDAATAIRASQLQSIPVGLDALVRAGRTLLVGVLTTGAAAAVEVSRPRCSPAPASSPGTSRTRRSLRAWLPWWRTCTGPGSTRCRCRRRQHLDVRRRDLVRPDAAAARADLEVQLGQWPRADGHRGGVPPG